MYSTGLILLVFGIFASVSSQVDLVEERIKLRRCYGDALNPHRNGTDKCTFEDFKKQIQEYIKAEKNVTKRVLEVNTPNLDIIEFSHNHIHYRHFLANAKCKNRTREKQCKDKVIGVSLNMNHGRRGKGVNLIYQLFSEEEEARYSTQSCRDARKIKDCVRKEALVNCDKNTTQFVMDLFDYNYGYCMNATTKIPVGLASGLYPTSFIFTVIIAVTLLLQ